jgi:5-methylcytosine-specific restriction endonuclease McrA
MSPEAHAHRLDYQRRYYQAHKAEHTERAAAWREKNRAKVNAAARARRKGNVELAARRRALRAADVIGPAYERLARSAAGAPCATRAELRALWGRQAGKCGLTGVPIPVGVKPHLDHIVPRVQGGAHTIENLRWVHPMANRAKGGHSDEEFLAWWNSR